MFRTVPDLFVAISLFLGTGLTGCFAFLDADSKALAPYATKTLIPGQGLGNLELGKTTLAGFVNQIGAGQVALIYGDEQGIELNFHGGQVVFYFQLPQLPEPAKTKLVSSEPTQRFIKTSKLF